MAFGELKKIKERQFLREKLMKELYENHFINRGGFLIINKAESDPEEQFTYEYLKEKGFINYEYHDVNHRKAWITANGIDSIEGAYLKGLI